MSSLLSLLRENPGLSPPVMGAEAQAAELPRPGPQPTGPRPTEIRLAHGVQAVGGWLTATEGLWLCVKCVL